MDFKALMTKLETIDKREILTEGEDRPAAKKKETTWTDKSGKQHPATRVQGSKSVAADKDADKERKKHDKDLDESMFKSSIAKALSEEFGYELDEADAPANPWANDPVKSAAWAKLSPEDQKWLGGADPTDEIILARAPNKGKPAAGAATKPAAGAAVPPGINPETGDAYTPVGDAPLTTPPGAEPDEPQASTLAEPPTDDGAATKPAAPAIDPAKIARFKELLAKASKPAAAPAAGAATKPAAGAATKPAAGTTPAAPAGGGNIADTPAAESITKLADDQILSIIKSIR